MKRRLLSIATTLFSGTLLVILLYQISGTPNTHKNGFNRKIKAKYLTPFQSMDLKMPGWQIVGSTKSDIFLWNRIRSNSIDNINYDLTKIHTEPWRSNILNNPDYLAIRIDSPSFEIYDRHHYIIYRYKLEQGKLLEESIDSIPKIPFDLALRISDKSYISRTINPHLKRITLTKFTYPGIHPTEDTTSIEKQVDGLICTDGLLCFDSSTKQIVYIYYYRNQYIVLDSNLLLKKKANTIDTVSRVSLNTHLFKESGLVTFESPTIPINKRAVCRNGRLFIQSGLLGDNEDRRVFSNSSVIDVYDLKQGRYLFSFYIPHYVASGITDFLISDSLIIAIQGKFIVSYQINSH